jgi:hypothetical protein
MTPYEAQSIEVARSTLTTYIVADIISGIALLAIITGGVVAYLTLKALLTQLRAAQWSALLSLEQDIASRMERFIDLAKQMDTSSSPLQKEALDAAKERYFNSIDRFASLVLNGQFPQSELKQDYQDLIKNIICTYPADFDTNTHYRKVVKLHKKWEEEK